VSDTVKEPFARLFAESRDALRRYIRRLVRSEDTAEEIVQEAFLRTYEQGGKARTPRAFLFSTARNLATDQRRRDRTAVTDSVGNFDESNVVPVSRSLDEVLIADEASRMLKQAIDRLPPLDFLSRSECGKRAVIGSLTLQNIPASVFRFGVRQMGGA
jgi:RNA polymerase sigma-70 factor (ECF subfamily)